LLASKVLKLFSPSSAKKAFSLSLSWIETLRFLQYAILQVVSRVIHSQIFLLQYFLQMNWGEEKENTFSLRDVLKSVLEVPQLVQEFVFQIPTQS